jgi:DivIVA domain-containing protein
VLAVLAVIAVVAAGRGDPLADPVRDRAPFQLPDETATRGDIDALRFAVGFRGYRMDQVDAALDRLATAIEARDQRIAELEAQAVPTPGPTPGDDEWRHE